MTDRYRTRIEIPASAEVEVLAETEAGYVLRVVPETIELAAMDDLEYERSRQVARHYAMLSETAVEIPDDQHVFWLGKAHQGQLQEVT